MSDAGTAAAAAGAGAPGTAAAAGAAAPLPAPAQTAATNAAAAARGGTETPIVPAALNRKERQILRKHFGLKIGKKADLAEEGAKFRQKQDERRGELKGLREKVPGLEGQLTHARNLIKAQADAALKSLPEAAQATVKAAAGNDPVKLLELIMSAQALIPGAQPAAAATAATTATATAAGTAATTATAGAAAAGTAAARALPAPAATAAAGQPPPAAGATQVNHRQVWMEMRDKHPMAAAHYALEHEAEIFDQAAQ